MFACYKLASALEGNIIRKWLDRMEGRAINACRLFMTSLKIARPLPMETGEEDSDLKSIEFQLNKGRIPSIAAAILHQQLSATGRIES